MKKHTCPHCHEKAFSTWQKSAARDNRPAICNQCGDLSYCSLGAHGSAIVSHEMVLWGVIILALSVRSWWALLLYPILTGLIFVLNYSYFPLKKIISDEAQAARRRMWKELGVIACVIGFLILVNT